MKSAPIIIVAILLLLAIGGGGGYWFWTTTPQYSLQQIKEAALEHNISKFQMYFGTDQVAESMVSDLMKSKLRKQLGGDFLERILSSGMVSESNVVHEVASGIAGDIKILVETGKFRESAAGEESASDKVSMGALDKRLGITTLSVKDMKGIKVDGNTATVTMVLHNGKFNTDLEMLGEMQNNDGYWQATRIINVVDCFQKLFDLEKQNTKSMRLSPPVGLSGSRHS